MSSRGPLVVILPAAGGPAARVDRQVRGVRSTEVVRSCAVRFRHCAEARLLPRGATPSLHRGAAPSSRARGRCHRGDCRSLAGAVLPNHRGGPGVPRCGSARPPRWRRFPRCGSPQPLRRMQFPTVVAPFPPRRCWCHRVVHFVPANRHSLHRVDRSRSGGPNHDHCDGGDLAPGEPATRSLRSGQRARCSSAASPTDPAPEGPGTSSGRPGRGGPPLSG